jgi:hypothetical protein
MDLINGKREEGGDLRKNWREKEEKCGKLGRVGMECSRKLPCSSKGGCGVPIIFGGRRIGEDGKRRNAAGLEEMGAIDHHQLLRGKLGMD